MKTRKYERKAEGKKKEKEGGREIGRDRGKSSLLCAYAKIRVQPTHSPGPSPPEYLGNKK